MAKTYFSLKKLKNMAHKSEQYGKSSESINNLRNYFYSVETALSFSFLVPYYSQRKMSD